MSLLADRLKSVREQRGFTQTELAGLTQLSSKMIWRYENEGGEPTANALAKLAKALWVSADYLIGLVDEPTGTHAGYELSREEHLILASFRRSDIATLLIMCARRLREASTVGENEPKE